ncbi:hypothetical protein P154DRAFT_598988 [Amniculicola lignicola CBS 123094]|uniref:Uncharacterized protein n=1 Tax=Amniculicola lignicola CBS 123094 TaxID=1392246 RepID=A0A6A5WHT6_9PLEO|nr:hypothetical protein P154DRAFT_598988 [Amniculicola lignicola CBS 123094]
MLCLDVSCFDSFIIFFLIDNVPEWLMGSSPVIVDNLFLHSSTFVLLDLSFIVKKQLGNVMAYTYPLSDSIKLFNTLQNIRGWDVDVSVRSEAILEILRQYWWNGKMLEWFQQIVPEVRPGIIAEEPWVEPARSMLSWSSKDREKHDRITKLHETLTALPTDRFRLRGTWVSFLRSLQHLSPDIIDAANAVYREVTGGNCRPDDLVIPTTGNDEHAARNEFLLTGAHMLRVLMNPAIAELRALGEELCHLDLAIARQEADTEADAEAESESPEEWLASMKQQRDELARQRQANDHSPERALVDFRNVLVKELGLLDTSK